MDSDAELLAEFAGNRSESAFAELVRRHVDLVYSAARRQCGGDPGEAEDATQAVFILLAEKARTLQGTPVAAWLFATTRYICSNARRTHARRVKHERKAAEMRGEHRAGAGAAAAATSGQSIWGEIAPLLDEAIDSLPADEKTILLSRFFEKRSFKDLGQQLQISEEAARKRVERATEKLRAFFVNAGVATTIPVAMVESAMLANAVTSAPATLAGAVATKSIAAGLAVGATSGVKWGSAAAAMLLVAGGVGAVVTAVVVAQMSSGPRARTVQVAPSPLPQSFRPTSITTAPSGVGAAFADTSNGLRIELLGVANTSAPDRWWRPNGSPTTRPIAPPTFPPPDTSEQRFIFVVRTLPPPRPAPATQASQAQRNFAILGSGMLLWDIGLRPQMTPPTSQTSWTKPKVHDGPDSGVASIETGWVDPPATFQLSLGVASGAWTTLAQSATLTQATTHMVQDAAARRSVTFTPLQNQRGKATLDVLYPPGMWTHGGNRPETRMLAITVDGHEVAGRAMRSGGLPQGRFGDTVQFEAPMEKIREIRFQMRAYEPVVFENVSLRAGETTDVKVTVLPPGAPMVRR